MDVAELVSSTMAVAGGGVGRGGMAADTSASGDAVMSADGSAGGHRGLVTDLQWVRASCEESSKYPGVRSDGTLDGANPSAAVGLSWSGAA
jgi:hypothetical protein